MNCRYGFYDELKDVQTMYSEAEMNGYLEMVTAGHAGFRASDFLHGFCWEFALMLHKLYGYPVIAIKDQYGSLVHAYCQLKVDGYDTLYVDVRGMTDSKQEIFDEFLDTNSPKTNEWGEYEVSESELDADDCDEDALLAAETLIGWYRDYYEGLFQD